MSENHIINGGGEHLHHHVKGEPARTDTMQGGSPYISPQVSINRSSVSPPREHHHHHQYNQSQAQAQAQQQQQQQQQAQQQGPAAAAAIPVKRTSPAAEQRQRPKPRAYSSTVFDNARPDLLNGINSGRVPKPQNKPRSRSSVTPRSKLRQSSFNGEAPNVKPLNTHSPIAVAAAAAVTADKIRKLLVAQGPLPIRHITSHLSSTIPGFGELSLSKQRRLIIAVLDGPKSEFVKVGWGRWAARGDTAVRSQSQSLTSARPYLSGAGVHRESISRNLPNSKPPLSPSLGPVEDSAVFSDSEDSDEFDDDSEVEGTDEEDWQAIGPTQLRQTSPREQDAIAALVQLRSN